MQKPRTEVRAARVVVVEDSGIHLELVTRMLEREGYRVEGRKDGVSGLELIRTEPPDLTILDYHLPGLNGWEICREIRRDPALSAMPILMLTSDESVETRLLDAGADDFLRKPVRRESLLARVRVQLRARSDVSGLVRSARLSVAEAMAVSFNHRIRNPLQAMMIGIEELRDAEGEERDALLESVEAALHRVIETLAALSKAEELREVPYDRRSSMLVEPDADESDRS